MQGIAVVQDALSVGHLPCLGALYALRRVPEPAHAAGRCLTLAPDGISNSRPLPWNWHDCEMLGVHETLRSPLPWATASLAAAVTAGQAASMRG